MENTSLRGTRRSLIAVLCVLGLLVVLTLIPTQFNWEVSSQGGDARTTVPTHEGGLDNYDVRSGAGKEGHSGLLRIRESAGKDAANVADIRDGFVRGEDALRQKVPTLKVEYSENFGTLRS